MVHRKIIYVAGQRWCLFFYKALTTIHSILTRLGKKKALINTPVVILIIHFDTASIELEHLLGYIWNLHNGPSFCCTHPPTG